MTKKRLFSVLVFLCSLILVGCTGSTPTNAPATRSASCGLGDGSGLDGTLGESIPHLSVSKTADPSRQFEARVDSIDAVLPNTSKTSLRLAKGTAWYQLRVRVRAGDDSDLTPASLLRDLRVQTGSERCFAAVDFSTIDSKDVHSTGSGFAKHRTVALKTSKVDGWLIVSTSTFPTPVAAQELRLVFVTPLDDAPTRVFWVDASNTYLGSWTAT